MEARVASVSTKVSTSLSQELDKRFLGLYDHVDLQVRRAHAPKHVLIYVGTLTELKQGVCVCVCKGDTMVMCVTGAGMGLVRVRIGHRSTPTHTRATQCKGRHSMLHPHRSPSMRSGPCCSPARAMAWALLLHAHIWTACPVQFKSVLPLSGVRLAWRLRQSAAGQGRHHIAGGVHGAGVCAV